MAEEQGIAASLSGVELATELAIVWLSNSNTRVTADEVAVFLRSMHDVVS